MTFISPRNEDDEPLTYKVVLARNAFCCLGANFLASLLFTDEKTDHQVQAKTKQYS